MSTAADGIVMAWRRSSRLDLTLLPNTKRAEDQVENVVGCGGAGDGIERPQGVVEIKQQHLVGNFGRYRASGGIERRERVLHQALMTDIGKKSSFGLRSGFAADVPQNFAAQFGDPVAGKSRSANLCR